MNPNPKRAHNKINSAKPCNPPDVSRLGYFKAPKSKMH